MPPPNILFLIADDHRHDAIGALGDIDVHTPQLDALVRAGTALTHAYIMGSTSGAVCMPSRAMLLTGRTLFRSFAPNPDGVSPYPLDPDHRLFPEVLRGAGYRTYGIGKWHNGREAFARAFSHGGSIFFGGMAAHQAVPVHDFDPSGTYPTAGRYPAPGFSSEVFADTAIELLREHPTDTPFCMYLAFTAPHDPRTPPGEFAARYDPAALPLPPNFAPQHPFDNGELDGRDELLAPHPRTPDVIRRHTADYYGLISHLDVQIGRLLAALDDYGLADRTLVVYTADHGLALGRHGLLGKQNLYEHSLRVPLVLRGPGIPSDQRRDAFCYLHDLYSTLLEIAGVVVPDSNEGRSLRSLLAGDTSSQRETIFAAYQRSQVMDAEGPYQRMVRDRRHKLIDYRVEGQRRVQLFDLVDDPWETRDLSLRPQHASDLARLQAYLREWQIASDDPAVEPMRPSGDA